MEVIKNNITYFYNVPFDKDYNFIVNILSDIGIKRCRINTKYCLVFYNKKILTKLKRNFKNVSFEGKDNWDNSFMYKIIY